MNNSKKIILSSLALCVVMGFLRVAITRKSDYLFMPWNIFLALVPLLLALKIDKFKGRKLWLLAVVWILFLPNSFYVITDLIHLNSVQVYKENIVGPFVTYDNIGYFTIVYDALYLFACATVSFVYGLESIRLFKNKFSKIISKSYINFALYSTFLLSGIAIYLGRFVRFNSWDIIVRPWKIVIDILDLFIKPAQYKKEWLVVLSFSFVIAMMYYVYDTMFKSIKISKK
ncbi:MAG: DUF1361 domain-containing protein [Candidatus Saccharibacteria bacterium]|nr:DUF1361 domain-containing protein [Candidatus Saccharibacteria bacterium]